MRPPLRVLLSLAALAATTNGLPYDQNQDQFISRESAWYNEKQNQWQENVFASPLSDILTAEQVPDLGTSWNQVNPALFASQSELHSGLTSMNEELSKYISISQSTQQHQQQVGRLEELQQQQQQQLQLQQHEIPVSEGELTLSCTGENKLCIDKDLCVNGYVKSTVQREIDRLKGQSRQCNLGYEVCCSVLLNDNYEQSSSNEDYANSGFTNTAEQYHVSHDLNIDQSQDGLKNYDKGNVLANYNPSQESTFSGFEQTINDESQDSQYIAPVVEPTASVNPEGNANEQHHTGSASDANSIKARPSSPVTSESSGSSVYTAGSSIFSTALPAGCAAALLCVEERFCTKEGVISTEPVVFGEKDLLQRVPLSSCRNPDNGIVGKCCRDPNYVDPWPTGNLPANYSGGFDEQGFPTFLNIAKVRPPKKPAPVTKVTRPVTPIGKIPTKTGTVLLPSQLPKGPLIPDGSNVAIQTVTIPSLQQKEIPDNVPQLPLAYLIPRPFEKPTYESVASDRNSVLVAPQIKGHQCGIRNNVVHSIDLQQPQVAFGEIPWQAMILSNEHRKILCSGVIIAPSVVLTTASCVTGLAPNEVSIKVGEWKLGYELKEDEPLPFEIVDVSSILIHPYFLHGASANDTAVLYLKHPVSYNVHVNALCMGNSVRISPERKCIATGWGKVIIEVHAAGAIMNGIDVDLLPPDVCKERLSLAEAYVDRSDESICVKAHNINNNMCQVDVGGPLACERENGIYELVGLYSQDTGCSPTNQVAVFTPIDTFWLEQTLRPGQNQEYIVPDLQQDSYEYRKSNLPSKINQYLPPV